MTKMVYVCDCCGMEVAKSCLHECYRALCTGRNCDPVPKTRTWEICKNCIDRIEAAMRREIDAIANSNSEPSDDMYAGERGIEVGGLA